MFIENGLSTPLEFRRNDMFIVRRYTTRLEFRRNGIEKMRTGKPSPYDQTLPPFHSSILLTISPKR